MKKFKKLLAGFMTLAMLVTMLPATVMAADASVATKEELEAAITNAESGDAITLTADINIEDTWGSKKVAAGVIIDGGGHTLSVDKVYNGGVNAIFYSDGSFTVQNMKFHTDAATGALALDMKNGGTAEEVTVTGAFMAGVYAGKETTVTECNFMGDNWGVYTEGVDELTITDTTFTGERAAMLRGDVTFTGNIVESKKGISVLAEDVLIEDNIFSGERAMELYSDAVISNNQILNGATVETDGAVTADLSGNYWGGDAPAAVGSGVTVNTYYTDAAMKDEDLAVVAGSGIVAKIGDAYYTDLHDAMVKAKSGETVELLDNVDLSGTEWEPVNFKGTFDGKGKTISNLTINKPGVSNTGFITSLNGTFENVTFTNPTVTGGECTGVLAGSAGGGAALAKNITVNGTIKVETTHSGYARAGVIVGGWAYGNYKDITVDGGDKAVSYIKHTGGGDGRYVAGIVGHADDVESYVNCTVKNITISGGWLCGGIAGPGPSDGLAEDCVVENVDINADYSGGMFGWYYGSGAIEDSTVKNVTFTAGGTNNGAIGGYDNNESANLSNVTIENVKNSDGTPLLSNVVATIGEVGYPTLQKALDVAAAMSGNVTVEILEDIDLTDVDWNPVTVSGPGYPKVTVEGNNKTITGLNDMLFAGTWAGGSGLVIRDLTIKDSNIVNDENDAKGTVGVGAFIGYPQASAVVTLDNCHLINSTVKGGHWTGGLVGAAAGYAGNDGPVFMNLTIKDCSVVDSTIEGKGSVGAIIGHGSQNGWTLVEIENTTVKNNTITSTGSATNKAGVVMGTIGAAGQPTTAAGETKTGGMFVDVTESGNTVKSNGTVIKTAYGRQGTDTGVLTITGGNVTVYTADIDNFVKIAEGLTKADNVVVDGTTTISEPAPVDPTPSNGGSTSKSYKAEVDEDIENGSIRLSREKAKPGTEVTITVTPDKGYKLDELKVLNSRGTEIDVTDNGDGTFTFKMPKGGVDIEASFVEGEAESEAPAGEKESLVLTINQVIYQLNGSYEVNDVAPIIKGDRTMLPIRLIAEFLGATVTWSEAEQSVTIVKDDTTIVIYIDQAFAMVNGEPVQLDAPAFIANDRTYLPLRFIAENLGAEVVWDGANNTVTIYK